MKIRKILKEMYVPNILYHGTDLKFITFNDSKPIFFTDNIQVAKSYGNNIVKVQLKLNNPIEVDCDGNSTCFFRGKNYLPSKLAEAVKELSDDLKKYGRLEDEYMEELEREYDWYDSYGDMDGIIMKNIKDSYGDVFAGDIVANNYVVFDKNQIKIIK
jgi:hypothetical protein